MKNTADIEGATPQKFRLKHKRHEYLVSPYHSSPERTTFTNTFKKMVIPHDVYHVPEIAAKITNVPAPASEVDPFGVSIRKDKFRDNDGRRLQQSSTLESLPPLDYGNSRESSSQSPIRLMQVQKEEIRNTLQRNNQGLQGLRSEQDEQRQSRNNFNGPSDNLGGGSYKSRRSQSNFVSDSIDQLKTEVEGRHVGMMNSESPVRGSYYKSNLMRQDSDQEHRLTESYYQGLAKESAQLAQQDSKYGKALKNFFGSTVNEPKQQPQANLNHSYAGYLPSQIGQSLSPSNLISEQKKIDYSFGGYGHSQYFQPKLNLNSKPELPFTLDPLTHQKIYKTGAKHQNNQSVQLATKPENDYFYARSNSPVAKLYGLH